MDAKILHELFEYRDGELYWKVDRYRVKSSGKLAGWIENTGYRRVLIDGKKYQIHRLVYMMHYGFMPNTIDHFDGNRLNNKIENLRPATVEENCRNSIRRTNNTSGVKGVFWNKQTAQWRAQIRSKGKRIHIGLFDSINEAENAIKNARTVYHGNFANHG